MTTSDQDEYTPPDIYLHLNLETIETAVSEIEAAIEVTPIKAILILNTKDNALPEALTKEFIATLQSHNIAVLLEDNPEQVITLGADGVHLNECDEENLIQTREKLSKDYIIGTGPTSSRDTAMYMAEKKASYIAILSNKEQDQDQDQDDNNQPPTIAWWSALFETPSVAWDIASIDEAQTAAKDGADFIALKSDFWQQGPNTKQTMTQLITAISDQT